MPTILFLAGVITFLTVTFLSLIGVARIRRFERQVYLWLAILSSFAFCLFSLNVFTSDRTFTATLYQLLPTLQFSFLVDRTAAFFMGIVSVVSVSAIIYSLRYGDHHGTDKTKNLSVALMALFILAMLLGVASANTFSLLFFWEVMSLTSFFLVMQDRDKKETQKSGLFYFTMTQMSTVFLLFGFLLLYGVTGSFNIQPISGGISEGLKAVIFLALFVGFGIKAGIMPFHKWLPYAHSASPSNISALMSGVMIKVAIYGLIRFTLFTLHPELWWGILILIFGSVSALLGVIYALKEHDLKKLLAYHSIENIGIILLGIGLYVIFSHYGLSQLALLALIGGLFHTLNHALFKSLLFLTAGSVIQVTGTRNIEEMGGLLKRMPATGFLFLIGAVSISALPPFNGFVSELMIFQSFFQSFQVGEPFVEFLLFTALAMFALTSAMAAACFVKAFGMVFLALPRSKEAAGVKEVPLPMLIGPGILAALCVFLGIFSYQILSFAGYHLGTPDLLPIGGLMLLFLGLTIALVAMTSSRKTRVSETWGCGLISQNSQMEYTASGFSEPILTIFRPIYRTSKPVKLQFWDRNKVLFKSGEGGVRTFKIFEEKIYMPLVHFIQRLSEKTANTQDVDLDTHILYAFVTIIVLLVLAWWVL